MLGRAKCPRGLLQAAARLEGLWLQWLLRNCSFFHSQPQTEPFWHPGRLRGHLLQPKAGRGFGGQGAKPHSELCC